MGALVSISMAFVELALGIAIRVALLALRGFFGVVRLAARLVIRAAKLAIGKRQESCEAEGARA